MDNPRYDSHLIIFMPTFTLVLTAYFLHVISLPEVAFSLVVQVAHYLGSDQSSSHFVGGWGVGRMWLLLLYIG
jgi:hypothetical protein